jgi:hypothetical protein
MDPVKLTAITSLKYGGIRYKSGDTFSANRGHAKALVAIKRARASDVVESPPVLVDVVPDATEVPENASEAPVTPEHNTYQTKHLEAETPREPAKRRSYVRRSAKE